MTGYWLRLGLICAGLGMAFAPPATATEKLLYRYIDDRGVVVLDDHVPPAYVHRGYTVLGAGGRVVREVPPALAPDEAAARRSSVQEAQRLREWDESLLRRYSTVADIEAARERALNEINIRLEILRSNLLSTKSQIDREQARAADIERRGVEVPADLIETIRLLQIEIDDTEDTIQQRRRDIDSIRLSYQRDIERFEVLLERLQLHRRGAGEQP